MGIETALGAGGAILGGIMGGFGGSQEQGGGTTTTSQTSAPWEPQQPFLTWGFDQAKSAADAALKNPVYQGNRVAALNPFQINAANTAGNIANNSFGNAQNAINLSGNVMNTGSGFANNAANLFSQYSGDPTQTILANANAYANSPYAQGLIDASSRDVTRNLYENQLPTLAKAAAGSGNTNSTRAGVESAIAQRGAADRLADVSSTIRGQLFNNGLQQSQNQYNQNLTNSLAANQQLYNAFNSGLQGQGFGTDMANSLFGLGNTAGSLFQTQNQNEINADMAKFNEQNNNSLDLLSKYMQLVQGNYGGTKTGTETAPTYGGGTAGMLSGLLGGATAGLGLGGKLGGLKW